MSQILTIKQKNVLAIISDLTKKNGVPPTFEEIRRTLDYSRISSVQRHTDALKKKGYLDQNTRGLSLSPIMDMNNIFTIRNESLDLLDPEPAVFFFRDLLWAEARRLGVPLNKIIISLWTNVPDGGVDAKVVAVDEIERIQTSGLIKAGDTSYQIKTGGFRPWRPKEIEKELFKGKSPNKNNLGSSIKACLDKDGTYVLVCFGKELADKDHRKAVKILTDYFKQCGYENPRVEVWGQSMIIGFTKIFPSLVLRFKNFDEFDFQVHETWALRANMKNNFEGGKVQDDLIENLRSKLRRDSNQAIHVRIWAEPGAGKKRLALEATNTEDLKPLVIYCDAADRFIGSPLMRGICDNDFFTLLVVNNCNLKNSSEIWNILKELGPRIKIVSIYNERDDRPGSTTYLNVPPLEKEQISEIIQQYGTQEDQADRWAELCSGSPGVAHVIGSNFKNNLDDILKPIDIGTIWDDYITGGDNPHDPEVKQRRIVLQYISLFKMFGFGGEMTDEARAIAKMLEKADPQITFQKFQQVVKKLKEMNILQGETTLHISPKALHVWLWREWWATYENDFDFGKFSEKLPSSLKEWLYEMFKYAAESDEALRIVAKLLDEDGLFIKGNYLKTESGSEFFLALAEANAEAALKCLQKTIGTWSEEELYQLKESRQNLVWALEKMAVWKKLFPDAARLLLALSEAENETVYSNNASGTFVSLFSPGPGRVAPTEASPEERFPVLQEALNSDSKKRRLLAINACGKGLEANYFCRMAGAEYQGLHSAQLWFPKNREEMTNAYIRIWKLLFAKLEDLSEDEQRKAVNVLLINVRSLTRIPELAKIIIPNIKILSSKSYVNMTEILETIETTLYYGEKNKELPADIMQRWKILRDNLIGKDFSSLMKRYVAMDLVEDQFDNDGNASDKAKKPIKKLVQQILSKPELLKPELSWLVTSEAKSGYRFAYELGQQDKDFLLLPSLLVAQRVVADDKNASDYFLGGYLKALFERDSKRWEDSMDDLAEDKKLASWVSTLTWRSGMSEKAALRVLNLAQKGILRAGHFGVFGLGSVISNLSEGVFKQWIEFLLDSSEECAVSIALDLYLFFYTKKDSKYTLPKELTLRLLTHPFLFRKPKKERRGQMDDFHWTEIGKKFIELHPQDSLTLADVILEHFGEDGTILEGHHKNMHEVINLITKQRPREVWKYVVKYLGPPIDSRACHIEEWLRDGGTLSLFAPEMVWQWIDQDVEKRAWYLAAFVPKLLFRQQGKTCWARELLVRYGDRKDVQENLMANFSSDGWSGSASLHYQKKKEDLLEFKEKEDNTNVEQWINHFVIGLDKHIEYEKIIEERRGF